MPLHEDRRFGRLHNDVPQAVLENILLQHRDILNRTHWAYCGYAALPSVAGVNAPAHDVCGPVDNAFRLGPTHGFERLTAVVTTGFRTSRFAPILFWEVLHALAAGGTWIDIDESSLCHGTGLTPADFPERDYFRTCLQFQRSREDESFLAQTFLKILPAPLSRHIEDDGWTFGILTAGPSPRAAQMAAAVLALDLPRVEVIFCGPRPAGLPRDARLRAVDIERPEPRGWITRKKNLIADAARYDNLCLLHDRYVITPEWADALKAYGPCYSFLTFPQVYYADSTRRFPQRYPDYQLLNQREKLARALETHVYHADRVFHPEYDDFTETAFCCGGLYIARRSLWNLIRQDEALFHCEWEDISFGLECQRRGLPHRVNPFVTAESAAAHPLLLTRLHTWSAPERAERGRLHVSSEHETAARSEPQIFKPVVGIAREQYYETARRRFNAIPGLAERDHIRPEEVSGCTGLADFWTAVARHVRALPLLTRDQIAQVAFFLSDTVYKWPTPQILSWILSHEAALAERPSVAGHQTVVGWGTGSAFTLGHRQIGRELAFLIDSRPEKWGTTVDGVSVRSPEALRDFDPATTAVVVFSCFVDEITALVRAHGAFPVLPAATITAGLGFRPLADLIAYFREVERYYPILFTDSAMEAAA